VAKEKAIRKGAFLFQRVQKIVASIVDKILANDGALTAEEETIIALSSEQLILKIEMDLATYSGKNNVISNQTEYIEALSFDVVTYYLQALLTEVQEAVGELSHAQVADAKKFEAFEQDTRETMRMLSGARIEARGRYELIANSKERLRRDVDYFDRNFESFIGSQNN
jgi:septal ring factor EnvC (AmiA/AmiB activator)